MQHECPDADIPVVTVSQDEDGADEPQGEPGSLGEDIVDLRVDRSTKRVGTVLKTHRAISTSVTVSGASHLAYSSGGT